MICKLRKVAIAYNKMYMYCTYKGLDHATELLSSKMVEKSCRCLIKETLSLDLSTPLSSRFN